MPRRGGGHNVSCVIDLHFISQGLAVGAAFPSAAVPSLAREHGIARVVDVRQEACDDPRVLRDHGILLLHLPTEDRSAVALEMLWAAAEFAAEGLDRGECVLIHCQYGIGRSALVALCVLVARGEAPLAALRRAKAARPAISPSPEQLEAFLAFSAAIRANQGATWEVPAFEEVAAIAWQHLLGGGEASWEDARAASSSGG
jgi:predicted protein tyrosine phosphatase